MNIEKFKTLRPYLYHLTDKANVQSILNGGKLLSTAALTKVFDVENPDEFLRSRRIGHKKIAKGDKFVMIRDQDPLSINILKKNLEGGFSVEDFIYSLNSRIFLWPTEKDLQIHYGRYENQKEYPMILRFKTEDVFSINKSEPQFCRLNSGAPRCSCYYAEGAPPRGKNTFKIAAEYNYLPSSVREVTFIDSCKLPEEICISSHPSKAYKSI